MLLRTIFIQAIALIMLLHCSDTKTLTSKGQEFIKKYLPDEQIAKILDEHVEELKEKMQPFIARKKKKHGVWTFDWLPNYYIKYNLDRIYGMEKMNRYIKKYHLDYLILPDKRLYHIKGRSEEIDNANYLIVVKKIEADPNAQPLTAEQTRQLCKLMEKTGYISMSRSNYIQTTENKIALIDTESTFDFDRTLTGLIRLIEWDHNSQKDYSEEGLKLILKRIITLLACPLCCEKHTYREVLDHIENIRGNQADTCADFFKELWSNQQHRKDINKDEHPQ